MQEQRRGPDGAPTAPKQSHARLVLVAGHLRVLRRRPGNRIGWLYAASGLAWSLNVPGQAWLEQLVAGGRPLPLAARLAAVIGEINWDPAILLGIILPALLVPDGRLSSPRWRLVGAAAVAGAGLDMVGVSLPPGRLSRLRDQLDLNATPDELLELVERATQPTQASLWLRPSQARRP